MFSMSITKYLFLEIFNYISCRCHSSSLELEDDEDAKFENIPEEIKRKITDFFEEIFLPALIKHIQPKCPELYGVPVEKLHLDKFVYNTHLLDGVFKREQQFDLVCLNPLSALLKRRLYDFEANEFVGAAIRLCKFFGLQEDADYLNQMVKGYITPEEHPDPEYLAQFH
jgi:hypothetical protein